MKRDSDLIIKPLDSSLKNDGTYNVNFDLLKIEEILIEKFGDIKFGTRSRDFIIFALLIIHYILELLGYTKHHKRAIVEKFALITKKEVKEVRKNTEELSSKFYSHFGHFGYYLALIFFAFTLGVAWAAVIAFALRLRLRPHETHLG